MSFSFSKDVVDWWSEQALKLAPYWRLLMGWMTETKEEELSFELKEILWDMIINSRRDCKPTEPPSEIDVAFNCGKYVIGLRGGVINPLTFRETSARYVDWLEGLGWFGVGLMGSRSIGVVAIYFKGEIPRVRLPDGRLITLYSLMLKDVGEYTLTLILFMSGVNPKFRWLWVMPYKRLEVVSADDVELVNALATDKKVRQLLENYINMAIGPLTELAKYQSIFILY
jgi:hypothetical protein